MGENDMSMKSLEDLLLHLQSLPPGTALSDVMSSITPPESVSALSQVALVRWFDPPIYNMLCDGLDGVPDFEAFTALPEITRLAPGRWHQSESSREPLLAAWQNPPSLEKWRQWNGRLTEHFHERLEELGLEAKLAIVYHAAAGPEPAALVEIFRDWFAAADNAFDMASANALLEMLKLKAQWRGEALSKLYLISNKAPQALTSAPIGSTVVHKYYSESQGNAPEQNPVSGGVVPDPVHGAIRHRVTVRGSA